MNKAKEHEAAVETIDDNYESWEAAQHFWETADDEVVGTLGFQFELLYVYTAEDSDFSLPEHLRTVELMLEIAEFISVRAAEGIVSREHCACVHSRLIRHLNFARLYSNPCAQPWKRAFERDTLIPSETVFLIAKFLDSPDGRRLERYAKERTL